MNTISKCNLSNIIEWFSLFTGFLYTNVSIWVCCVHLFTSNLLVEITKFLSNMQSKISIPKAFKLKYKYKKWKKRVKKNGKEYGNSGRMSAIDWHIGKYTQNYALNTSVSLNKKCIYQRKTHIFFIHQPDFCEFDAIIHKILSSFDNWNDGTTFIATHIAFELEKYLSIVIFFFSCCFQISNLLKYSFKYWINIFTASLIGSDFVDSKFNSWLQMYIVHETICSNNNKCIAKYYNFCTHFHIIYK